MARVNTHLVVGKTRVATESRHLLGPTEGKWWKYFSWWAIPLGVLLLVWPGWLHQGIDWAAGGGGAATKVVAPVKVTVRVETPGLDKAITTATAKVTAAAEKAAKTFKARPPPPPIIVQVPAPAPASTTPPVVEKQEQPVPPPPPVKKEEKPKSIWFYNR